MKLEEFAPLVPNLKGMSHVERIKHLAWYVLAHGQRDRFSSTDIKQCYESLHYVLPVNLNSQLQQMAAKKPPDLLKDARGYRLEGRTKEKLDGKYAQRAATIVVDAMLQSLPGKVSSESERLFLSEALACYRNKAFRAAIVMTWNLAFDHLLNWIIAKHLGAFNSAIIRRYPKRVGVAMTTKEDFNEAFKESEVLEVCGTAGILLDNTKKILNEKLTRRNMAAHPSLVEITQFQAEDVITDLVNNVILKLT